MQEIELEHQNVPEEAKPQEVEFEKNKPEAVSDDWTHNLENIIIRNKGANGYLLESKVSHSFEGTIRGADRIQVNSLESKELQEILEELMVFLSEKL